MLSSPSPIMISVSVLACVSESLSGGVNQPGSGGGLGGRGVFFGWSVVSDNIARQLTVSQPTLAKQNACIFVFVFVHTIIPMAWSVTILQGGNFGP